MHYDKIQITNCNSGLNFITFVKDRKKNYPNLLISHGSAGIKKCLNRFISLALKKEYNVIIPDHYTFRGIVSQWWHKLETNCTMLNRMQDIIEINFHAKIDKLCGISAGGTAILMASGHIKKPGFAIYPSTFPLTESLVNCYKSMLITGIDDDWTTLNHAKNLTNISDCELIQVPGYHGFLNKKENRYLKDNISYRDNCSVNIYSDDNTNIIPLARGVTVKYNKLSTKITLNEFGNFLDKC